MVKFPSVAELATPEIFNAVIDASNAMARLDELASVLENNSMFINAIPVIESQANCAIESVVTTHDSIFRADVSANGLDENTILAVRLRRAIQQGTKLAKQRGITAKLAAQLCTELMGRQMRFRSIPGAVIRSGSKTVYLPPEPKDLPALMLSWEKYVNRDDILHPLVIMAVSHYLFEAIHPFSDGNGRTGRVLNVLQLVAAGLLQEPILHMSKYLNENRAEYYQRLRAVDQKGDWTNWVLFMLKAVTVSAIDARSKLKGITELQLRFAERYLVRPDLAELLFEKPYLQISQVVQVCEVTRLTASKWLKDLEAQGALRSFQCGREKFFINFQLVKLLAK